MSEITKLPRLLRLIQAFIFQSKWILVFFYLGLIWAQILYCFKFCQEIYSLTRHFTHLEENEIVLSVLTLIDFAMIASLLKMIVSGSYQTFISKVEDSMEKVSSGVLKVKMGSSLVGVSSIHLLQAFINVKSFTQAEIYAKCGIHVIFLLSVATLALVDRLLHPPQVQAH